MKDRMVMTLCVHLSLFLHWWLFLNINTYVQVTQVQAEKTALLKSMAYARRIGIDVSQYQSALKAPPFAPRFEQQLELAQLIHADLRQMLRQVNSAIAHGDYSQGAANNDAVLIVVSGDENVISHALLVHPNGRVECHVDRVPITDVDRLGAEEAGGRRSIAMLDKAQTKSLFALLTDPNNLETLPADRKLPDDERQTPQMLYVDYKGHSTPNLLCAGTPDGQDLASACQKIERQLNMAQIAHLY